MDQSLNAFTRVFSLRRTDAGPLADLTISLKENFNVAGYPTTCASPWLQDYVPEQNAVIVDELLKMGAHIIGKNNMDEFGMGSYCINSIHGPSRNPLDPSRVTGGSTGGGAAAVAAGLVDVAIGSDTGGSCRLPAAWCRVWGLKPTGGRISRNGLVAYASSLDTVGLVASQINTLQRVFDVLKGTTGEGDEIKNTVKKMPQKSLTRVRIGVITQLSETIPSLSVREQLASFVELLRLRGMVVENVSIPSLDYALATYYVLATIEAASCLARYPSRHFSGSINQTIPTNTNVQNRLILGRWMASYRHNTDFFARAQAFRQQIIHEMDKALVEYDYLLAPTSPIEAPFLEKVMEANQNVGSTIWKVKQWEERLETSAWNNQKWEELLLDLLTVPASLARVPALSIPVGPTNFFGGMQLMTGAGRDEELLNFIRDIIAS